MQCSVPIWREGIQSLWIFLTRMKKASATKRNICLLIFLLVRLQLAQETTPETKRRLGHECGGENIRRGKTTFKGSMTNQSEISYSRLRFSEVNCSLVVDSTLEKSKVNNSELIASQITAEHSEHSYISWSTVEASKIVNSIIINSDIHASDIRWSFIKDYPGRIIMCCYKNCKNVGMNMTDWEGKVFSHIIKDREGKLQFAPLICS